MLGRKYIILFLLLAVPYLNGVAIQPSQIGNTYLETFQGKCGLLEKSQIWSIVSGNDGYLYFASNNGLGVYDGIRWETNNTKEGLTMRSLYFDSRTNTLYCGSVNQFGKWTQDEYGKFQYEVLWTNQEKNMTLEFWRIGSPTGSENIYVQAHQMIVKYNTVSGEVDTLKASDNFSYMHIVAGDIWVQEANQLYRIDANKKMQPVISVDDRVVYITKRDSDKRTVLFLEHKGAFILSNNSPRLIPLNVQTNATLSRAKIFAANESSKGEYLVGTTKGGLYVLNQEGVIIKNIDEVDGLPTSTVLSASKDNYDNIWMGLDAGIATLDTGDKETYFTPKPSIGYVRDITSVDGELFIGTNQGLFKLSADGNIHPIEGTAGSLWSMQNIDGVLYFNHDLGLFRMKGNTPTLVKRGGTTSLVQSISQPNYSVGADYYGLSLYKREKGEMMFVTKIKGYGDANRYILFDKHGYLWIVIPKVGFVRLTLSEDMQSVMDIKRYDISFSETNDHFFMTVIDNQLVFYNGTVAHTYNSQSEKMEQEKTMSELFQIIGNKLVNLTQFEDVFWYQTSDDIGYVVRKGSKLEKHSGIFSRIYSKRVSPFLTKLNTDSYAVGFQNGVAFTELSQKTKNHLKIRSVEAYGVGEHMFHNFDEGQFDLPNNKKIINIYPVNLNSDYLIEYRVMELDSAWVKHRIDNYLTLTHLESGLYTIQLRNANDVEGNPAQILVNIALPWYISIPMILVYTLILSSIILVIVFYFRWKGKKDKRRIERIRQAQVDKLEKKNLELEQEKMKVELEEKDKRLAFITMNGVKRNNLMIELKNEIEETKQYDQSSEAKQTIKKVIKKIENELDSNEDWEVFEEYFDVVFGGLLGRLVVKYPQLSRGDLKHLAYLKLNLSNKEVANLLNVSYRSVEMAKYRLRKKLNLDANDNFSSILNEEH